MNEARIILPMRGKNGEDLGDLHSLLADSLIYNFGGYTAHNGVGGWQAPGGGRYVEKVVIYDVAMELTSDNQLALCNIAAWIATKANQEAVYVRQATGQCMFVGPNPAAVPAQQTQIAA